MNPSIREQLLQVLAGRLAPVATAQGGVLLRSPVIPVTREQSAQQAVRDEPRLARGEVKGDAAFAVAGAAQPAAVSAQPCGAPNEG